MCKKVIVADDEAHILHIVSMKLRNAGYKVITAMDGEEALELCRSERPDMLITDFQMPYMSGLELCMKLQESEDTKHIPALMLTARGFNIEPSEMVASGIKAVLAKPFSPREILQKVKDMIGEPQAVATTE